jgi:hypothetical protein
MPDKKPKPRKAPHKPAPRKTDDRTLVFGIAAGLGAIAAIVAGFSALARRKPSGAEHAAPDLAADAAPVGSQRAPEAFRPDPTAPVPDSEREALRPATGPGPSITSPRGELANQTGAANG